MKIEIENKELLLKDLCGRLPYGVKCEVYDRIGVLDEISSYGAAVNYNSGEDTTCRIEYVKPYLFPLSSMTEEQTEELLKLINTGQNDNNEFMRSLCRIEFYHKYHFDYRDLIPKGLAKDATGLNIY